MTRTVFADTYYYLAAVNPNDAGYAKALEFGDIEGLKIVTSEWVLLELADALADTQDRRLAVRLIDAVRADPRSRVISLRRQDFDEAFALYRTRSDKGWSLTDCTSFVIMERMRLSSALTADRHFVQAGFEAMLA